MTCVHICLSSHRDPKLCSFVSEKKERPIYQNPYLHFFFQLTSLSALQEGVLCGKNPEHVCGQRETERDRARQRQRETERRRQRKRERGRVVWKDPRTHLRTVLLEHDFAHNWISQSVELDWTVLARSAVRTRQLHDQARLLTLQSSLKLYSTLGHDFTCGINPYLDDRSNIFGTRLKTALRLGTLWVMTRVVSVLKWSESHSVCTECTGGSQAPLVGVPCSCTPQA